jgi:hypothetical protein
MQREAGQEPVLAGAAAGPAHTLLQTALDTYRREHHTWTSPREVDTGAMRP